MLPVDWLMFLAAEKEHDGWKDEIWTSFHAIQTYAGIDIQTNIVRFTGFSPRSNGHGNWGKAAETLGETKTEVKKSVKGGKGGTQSKEREELSPEELEERRQKRREEHLGSFCAWVTAMFFFEGGWGCRWWLLCALSSVGWCVPYTNLSDQWPDVKDERMKDEQTSHDWAEHAKELMSCTRHMRQTMHCDDDGWSSCLRLVWKICSCNSSPTKIRMEEDLFPRLQVEEGRGKAERNCKVPI